MPDPLHRPNGNDARNRERSDFATSAIRRMIAQDGLDSKGRLPGERRLAEQLGVARITVRQALADLAAEGLIEASQGSRWQLRPAPAPRGQTVLLIDPAAHEGHATGVLAGYQGAVREASLTALAEAGIVADLIAPADLAGEGIRKVLARRPAALLVTGPYAALPQVRTAIEACAAHGVPVVAQDDAAGEPLADLVGHDHAAGAASLVGWLAARGHRRLLLLARFPQRPAWWLAREQGFQAAVAAAGLEVLPTVQTSELPNPEIADEVTFAAGLRGIAGMLVEHLVGPNPIDAICCAVDPQVHQCAAALRLFGITPNREVALVGYDNAWEHIPSRRFEATPPLATVDKDNAALGRRLAAIALERLAGDRSPPRRELLPGRLVVVAPGN